jgi:UDP-N-acetylglucosamine acyltransferase
MSGIDPTARIDKGAQIGNNVTVGPYCVVGPNVIIGDECALQAHVHVAGHTTIGARTRISAFASLGTAPQSVHYKGEPTALRIGDDCDIREHVTMNIGTAGGRGETVVGNNCFFMVGTHIAHDCRIGNNVTFANNATLGGHVEIGDHTFMGGLCAVHQFVRIGESVMVGGLTGVAFDVIPFAAVVGDRANLAGLNRVGLKRRGFTPAEMQSVYKAYRAIFFAPGRIEQRVAAVAEHFAGDANVMRMVEFIRSMKTRKLTPPRRVGGRGAADD